MKRMGVLILLVTLAGCGSRGGGLVDDGARILVEAVEGADQLDDAGRLGRSLPGLLDDVPVAPAARSSVDAAVDAVNVDDQITRDALRSLSWEVFCDVVTGEVPSNRRQLTDWTQRKAAAFGVQFLGSEGLNGVVDGILAATEDESSNPSTDACNLLAKSGL